MLTASRLWALLDPGDIDRTVERWLVAVLSVVRAQHAESARLAGGYLAAFRTLEVGEPLPVMPTAADIVEDQVTTSLLVTGPFRLRHALAANLPTTGAQAGSAAAAMRHSLAGGRDLLLETVRADPKARGWRRVASGRACSFCLMLASRGVVYREDTADFQAHDHCGCSAEVSYR